MRVSGFLGTPWDQALWLTPASRRRLSANPLRPPEPGLPTGHQSQSACPPRPDEPPRRPGPSSTHSWAAGETPAPAPGDSGARQSLPHCVHSDEDRGIPRTGTGV